MLLINVRPLKQIRALGVGGVRTSYSQSKNFSLREADVSVQKSQITLGNLIKINYTITVTSAKYVGIENTTV